ncbi:MAG: TatD family hydrolase [Myxococcales bacterium]|nr:TatD family hydrolase [Myxococcales bacterium]
MRLFDTHAHIDLPRFGSPEEQRLAANRASSAGIAAILIPGVEPATWPRVAAVAESLSAKTPGVRFHTAFGVHPFALSDLPASEDRALASRLAEALERRGNAEFAGSAAITRAPVAIGECGLDFARTRDAATRARQLAVLDVHIAASRRTGLPLLVHCVKAHGALLDRLLAAPTPPAVLHAFSGSAEVAAALCRAGHYIAFAGAVTNPRARKPKEAAAAVPADRLLLETDAPDQTPFARRPARNEPAFIVDTARAIADLRGVTLADLAEQTTANACRVLRVELPD